MLCDLVVRPFQSTDAAPVSALIATTMRQSNARDYPPDRLLHAGPTPRPGR